MAKVVAGFFIAALWMAASPVVLAQSSQPEITQKEREIAELNRKINELSQARDETSAETAVIAAKIGALTAELHKAEIELEKTQLTIQQVQTESEQAAADMEQIEQQVVDKRQQLRGLVRLLHEKEQESFLAMLLRSGSISEALAERSAYEELQQRTVNAMHDLRQQIEELEEKQAEFEQQKTDLSGLQNLQQIQQSDIAVRKADQQEFLIASQDEKLEYENLIAEAKQARAEIEQHIFTLKDAGKGVNVTLTEATDMAKLAQKLTGVRPELLMAVLKVESRLGESIGTGKFPDDMHPGSRDAFLRITSRLGLDPNTAPISARPKSFSGWGGAMGPAQVMPATWEAIESRVASLLGKPSANPYELTDAFVATAVLLSDRGAADSAKEYEAVLRYLAGPNWQRFTWYGDRVLAVARQYEDNI